MSSVYSAARELLSTSRMRIGSLLLTLSLATAAFAQQTNDLIIPIGGAPDILIPAAGDVSGANGTHFRSDISVINLLNVPQRVQLHWLPQGSSGTSIAPQTIDLSAKSGFQSDNFVGEVMSQTGLGSIEVVGVRQDGSVDPNARLLVAARIWTPRPEGAQGTMSQTFPAIALTAEDIDVKAIFGLRRTSQYRFNVGISNPISSARRFRVTVIVLSATPVQTQFDVDVAGNSMEQRSVTGASEGLVQVLVEDISTSAVIGPWHAWGSSIDNNSGDAWSHMAVPGM
jgi:hypothetical protein